MAITYNKSDGIAPAAGASAAVVIDLGLGIDEAARILGVVLNVASVGIFAAGTSSVCYGALSFDPEDTTYAPSDDEQFVACVVMASAIAASTGAHKQSESIFVSFIGMNLVTTRNLALVGTATGLVGSVETKVYYEKYKPSANELIQLIATRR